MIDVGTLSGGINSSGYGINNSGQVVGESDTGPILHLNLRLKSFSLYGTHAFLWTEGAGMMDLGHLGGGTSRATAISNNGVVVGTSALINGTDHAFRWTQASGLIDLNTLLKPNSGWVLVDAYGVNDHGLWVAQRRWARLSIRSARTTPGEAIRANRDHIAERCEGIASCHTPSLRASLLEYPI